MKRWKLVKAFGVAKLWSPYIPAPKRGITEPVANPAKNFEGMMSSKLNAFTVYCFKKLGFSVLVDLYKNFDNK